MNETIESWINPAVASESTGVGVCCSERVYIYNEINLSPEIGYRCSHRLRKAHQSIKGSRVRGEIHALRSGNSESMSIERESGNGDVVRDNITRNLTCPVCNRERCAGVLERATRLRSEEVVISLKLRTLEKNFRHVKREMVTHTSTTIVGLTVLRSDPEIGRTRVHKDQKVTRRRSDLHGREITNVLGSG